ncbi:MAG: VanW family protein [Roseburia sp.]|nr:VanW family protein [Roseburia sp.]MCM1278995.1 VanW family protein [Robinsoniella sp.]
MRKYIIPLFTVFLFFLFVGAMDMETHAAANKDTIENGIFIGEVEVSGMTKEEALLAVSEYISSLEGTTITLNAMNDNHLPVSAGDLKISWKNQEVIEEALSLGKVGNIVQRYKALKDLEYENKVFEITYDFDKEAITKILEEDCAEFNVSAQDAILKRENGAFVIEPGQTGVVIDVAGSTSAIYDYLTTEWTGDEASIDLKVEVEEPRGTEEELSKVKDVLGTFTTSYSSSGYNRSGNVANGCRLVDGTLLYPGDSFSMYETVSPFTEANGYFEAGSYLNGMVVDSLGGGICQVSTTLYNAVLKAELDVTERHNHSMIVTYVDPSADAAIAGTAKDFKFVNNLEHPIYIEGATSDKKITFTIYGVETRPSNRKVTYESEVLSKTTPDGEKVIADGGQPIGFIDVQSAHIGYVAQLWKIVTVDGVEESRTQVNKSTYKMTPRTAVVGTASADPNATAAVNAAIATQNIDHVKSIIASVNSPDPAQAAAQAALAQQQAAIAAQQAAAQQAAQAQQEAQIP